MAEDTRPIDQVEQMFSKNGVQNVPQISSRGFTTRSIVILTLKPGMLVGHPQVGTPIEDFFHESVKTADAVFESVGPAAHECTVLVPNPEDPQGAKWRMHVTFDDIKLKPKKEASKKNGGVKPAEIPNARG